MTLFLNGHNPSPKTVFSHRQSVLPDKYAAPQAFPAVPVVSASAMPRRHAGVVAPPAASAAFVQVTSGSAGGWRPGRVPLNHAAAQLPRCWGMGNAPQSGGGKIKALEDSRLKPRPSRRRSQKVRGLLPWTPRLFVHKIPPPVRSWSAPLSGCGLA